jgi:hypothetical protein
LGSWSTPAGVLFGWGVQELSGGGAVSDGGGFVESEYDG